jgi:uncharacterized protein (TIGR02646 family)
MQAMGKGERFMKHIAKSGEPAALHEYRQNNLGNRWENFRHECQSGLKEVYETLSKDHGGLCAYCEMKINPPNHQVEHFHDKSDTSDANNPTRWHLDWDNMLYCCKGGTQECINTDEFLQPISDNTSCGQQKQTDDYKKILSPQEIPAFPRIFSYKISDNGVSIHVDEILCSKAGIDKNRAEQTIEILNLNCKRLCEARRAVLKPYMTLHEKKPDRNQLKKLLTRLIGNKYENGCWRNFFTMIRYRFGNVAEEYLEEIQFIG